MKYKVNELFHFYIHLLSRTSCLAIIYLYQLVFFAHYVDLIILGIFEGRKIYELIWQANRLKLKIIFKEFNRLGCTFFLYFCRMFQKTAFFSLIILVMALGSCKSTYQKLLKSTDQEAKYEAAIDYFEKKNYTKALELFDLLQAVFRGTSKGEEISYRMAYCYYNLEDYIVASYYFKKHAQTYPLSVRAEECLYMNAYCYFLDSPRYSLDQSNTLEALKELQAFIDLYPRSSRVAEANNLIDELRAKLEQKDYNIAILFYKMRDYMAAITSFQNLLKRFPDTERREEVLNYMTLAYFEFAERSIPEKRRERYESAIETYNNLLYQYPESKYLKSLEPVQAESRKKLSN